MYSLGFQHCEIALCALIAKDTRKSSDSAPNASRSFHDEL
jgi:hypothetical protein